jgi:hypothetical protein
MCTLYYVVLFQRKVLRVCEGGSSIAIGWVYARIFRLRYRFSVELIDGIGFHHIFFVFFIDHRYPISIMNNGNENIENFENYNMSINQRSFAALLRALCEANEAFKHHLLLRRDDGSYAYTAGRLAKMHPDTDFAGAYHAADDDKKKRQQILKYASKALKQVREQLDVYVDVHVE